jgi:hypothetical protein
MNEAYSWSTTRLGGTLSQVPHIQFSLRIIFDLQSDQRDVSFRNMTMLGPILPVQYLQQSKTSTSAILTRLSPMFGPLKEAVGGKKFRSDEEVLQAVHEWLRRQPQEFFPTGIHTLCKRYRGLYWEKMETM